MLHKITSSSPSVLEAFLLEDCTKGVIALNLGVQAMLIEHSLGLSWKVEIAPFKYPSAATHSHHMASSQW